MKRAITSRHQLKAGWYIRLLVRSDGTSSITLICLKGVPSKWKTKYAGWYWRGLWTMPTSFNSFYDADWFGDTFPIELLNNLGIHSDYRMVFPFSNKLHNMLLKMSDRELFEFQRRTCYYEEHCGKAPILYEENISLLLTQSFGALKNGTFKF